MRKYLGILAALVNLGLGLYCLALGALGLIAGGDMHVPLLSAEPENAAAVLAWAGGFALVAAAIALSRAGWSSVLMLVWNLALVWILGSAVFRGGYRFDGWDHFKVHVAAFLGSILLLVLAWVRLRTPSTPAY